MRRLQLLRTEYHFNGYIHVKAVPGTPDDLIMRAGYLADRMSINLELPTAEGMKKLAPNKSHQTILKPMAKVRIRLPSEPTGTGKGASIWNGALQSVSDGQYFFGKEQRKITGKSNGSDRRVFRLSDYNKRT